MDKAQPVISYPLMASRSEPHAWCASEPMQPTNTPVLLPRTAAGLTPKGQTKCVDSENEQEIAGQRAALLYSRHCAQNKHSCSNKHAMAGCLPARNCWFWNWWWGKSKAFYIALPQQFLHPSDHKSNSWFGWGGLCWCHEQYLSK